MVALHGIFSEIQHENRPDGYGSEQSAVRWRRLRYRPPACRQCFRRSAGSVRSWLRTLGRRFRTRTRQRRPNTSAPFGNEQSLNIRILINYACAVLKKTAGIGSRAIRAVQFVAKHTQIGPEFAAVMGGMGDGAHENPG